MMITPSKNMTKPFNTLRKKMSLPARKAAVKKTKKLIRLVHKHKNWSLNGKMWRNLFKVFGIEYANYLYKNRMLKIEDFFGNDSMASVPNPSDSSNTDMH